MDRLKKECQEVLFGRILPEEVINQFDDEKDFLRVANNLEIEIRPVVVIKMLEKFLNGEKTKDELQSWALFISLTGAFATPNWRKDETFRYDPMWTILGRISTPEIDGEITSKIAKEYIKELKSIKEKF